jgi:hypothetical protein
MRSTFIYAWMAYLESLRMSNIRGDRSHLGALEYATTEKRNGINRRRTYSGTCPDGRHSCRKIGRPLITCFITDVCLRANPSSKIRWCYTQQKNKWRSIG